MGMLHVSTHSNTTKVHSHTRIWVICCLLWPQYHCIFSCQIGRYIKCVVWHGHTLGITGPLCGESTSCQWIFSMKPVMERFDCARISLSFYNLSNDRWNEMPPSYKSAVPLTTCSIFSTIPTIKNSVRCRYNTVSFLQNPHNRRLLALLWGRSMGGFCDFEIWFVFCCCHCTSIGNLMIYCTTS